MQCSQCHAELGVNDRFCSRCGSPAPPPAPPVAGPAYCAQCGAQLPPGSRFCGDCGNPVAAAGPAADSGAAARPASAEPKHTLEEIREVLSSGAADKAKEMVLSYLQDRTQDAIGWVVLGNVESDLENDDAAAQAYWHALRLSPNSHQAYTGLGILARRRGDNDEAMEFYRKAVEAQPDYAPAYSSMAVIQMRCGNNREAVKLAEKAWSLDKDDAVVAANLAVAYHCAGRVRQRDRMYKEAQRLGYPSMQGLDEIFRGDLDIRQ